MNNKVSVRQGITILNSMSDFKSHVDMVSILSVTGVIDEVYKNLNNDYQKISEINLSMTNEVSKAIKTNPFKSLKEQEADTDQFRPVIFGTHFIRVAHEIVKMFRDQYGSLQRIAANIIPDEVIISSRVEESGSTGDLSKISQIAPTTESLKELIYEFQLNQFSVEKFLQAIIELNSFKNNLVESCDNLTQYIERYYLYLQERHKKEGVKIHNNAIITDLAHVIFANIDAHGEIDSGAKVEDISAYTLNKGMTVIQAASNPLINKMIHDTDELVNYIKRGVNGLCTLVDDLLAAIRDVSNKVVQVLGWQNSGGDVLYQLNVIYNKLIQVNPASVIHKPSDEIFVSEDERVQQELEDNIIKSLVEKIHNGAPARDILLWALENKEKKKKFFLEENTFYVCQISQGNPFLGEAPGALRVIPGKKSNIDINSILGSGFDGIREFYNTAEMSVKWAPLFIATSPSKTADKSNCLMIGPPGCGKTEIMRAIGSDKNSIGIFAQGSDFLTCWKGEAEKNPKRLFEQALKLHKESGKRVYILIDEIDSVLKKVEAYGEANLTLEFQILMDGIVAYPGISVWGATNNPDKIPMPMIRRFNKIEIVGELGRDDRIGLMRNFLSRMPQKDFSDEAWGNLSDRLEGATGDVVRQVCDMIWRDKVGVFIRKHGDKAEEMVKLLSDREGPIKEGEELNKKLEHFFNITPSDVGQAIDEALSNMAIKSEIETAVNSYRRAKEFMKS